MAATGKTPILLYGSTTPTNAPTVGNLTNSSDGCEIAINVADKNLFFKDSTNALNTVPIRQSSASSNGWLSSTDWTTFNNKAPAFTYTTGYIPFGQGTTTPAQDANLFWNDASNYLGVGTTIPGATITSAPRYGAKPTNNSVINGVSIFNDQDNVTGDGVALFFDHSFGTPGLQTRGAKLSSYSTTTYSGDVDIKVTLTSGGSFIETAQFRSNGNFDIKSGNLVIGTSGKGIDFSATAGTGTSELLADYEEGTWTPTVTASSGSITSYTATGTYTKIGRVVYCSLNVQITNNGTGAGNLSVTLPFTSAVVSTGLVREANLTGNAMQISVNANTTANILTLTNGYPASTGYGLISGFSYSV